MISNINHEVLLSQHSFYLLSRGTSRRLSQWYGKVLLRVCICSHPPFPGLWNTCSHPKTGGSNKVRPLNIGGANKQTKLKWRSSTKTIAAISSFNPATHCQSIEDASMHHSSHFGKSSMCIRSYFMRYGSRAINCSSVIQWSWKKEKQFNLNRLSVWW